MRLKDVIDKHPELKDSLVYNPSELPRMCKNLLLQWGDTKVALENGIIVQESNIPDLDLYVVDRENNNIILRVDSEYDNSGIFHPELGNIKYKDVGPAAEKLYLFKYEKPTVWVKVSKTGKWCLLLKGSAICKFGKSISKQDCKHETVLEDRDFIRVNVKRMLEIKKTRDSYMVTGLTEKWISMLVELYKRELFSEIKNNVSKDEVNRKNTLDGYL